MKKQTAVEWLEKMMNVNGNISVYFQEILDQAKAMEKEQIEEALLTGLVHWDVDKPIEQYYNETFKSE